MLFVVNNNRCLSKHVRVEKEVVKPICETGGYRLVCLSIMTCICHE